MFAEGARGPLAGRGYRVPQVDGALRALEEYGLSRAANLLAPGLPEVGTKMVVDAVMVIEIRKWNTQWSDALDLLQYDISYKIVEAASERVLWQHDAIGSYIRPKPQTDPDQKSTTPF